MTSEERREVRYHRRKARRLAKRQERQRAFEDVFTFDNLYEAYRLCCRGVMWKASTQVYKANAMLNIHNTKKRLLSGKYKHRGFTVFHINERGKPRKIQASHISDRVVQRCLCDHCMVPQMSPTWIYDNSASQKGKGMDFSLNRLDAHLHRHYRKHGASGYILQIDFKDFFGSLCHATAFREIDRNIFDPRLNALAKAHLTCYGDRGVGLGAMPSQTIAIATPNRLDHFIKEQLHIKGYGRYMDDSYLIHEDKEYLKECLVRIRAFCAELGITISDRKTKIIKLTKGFKFLKIRFRLTDSGAVIRKPNRKGISRMRRKLRVFRRWVSEQRMTYQDVENAVASWRGGMIRSRAYWAVFNMTRYFKYLFREEIKSCIA